MWSLEDIVRMNREAVERWFEGPVKWSTGNHTSIPHDQRCFLEDDDDGRWWVYQTGDDGRMMKGFPKLREEPFESAQAAQAWVEKHVPAHPVKPDLLQRALAVGTKIQFADENPDADLDPWIDRILQANGIKKGAYITTLSAMGDFIPYDEEARHIEVQNRLEITFALDEYVCDVARRLRDRGEN